MNTFILRLMACMALVWAAAAEGNCLQSFNVSTTKSVPTSISIYGGMRCPDIERLRADLYIQKLSGIDIATFKTFAAWETQRDAVVARLAEARIKLAEAKKIDATNAVITTAVTFAFQAAGDALTLSGCPALFTAPGATTCVLGFALTRAGTIYALTTLNVKTQTDQASAVLKELETTLNGATTLGQNILDAMKQQHLQNFDEMCKIVEDNCL